MSEQTPATQEEKQPLSPEEMLEYLQEQAFYHRSQQHYYQLNATTSAKLAGGPELHPKLSAWHRDSAEGYRTTSEDHDRQADILERTIAILSVLTHPDFFQLEDFGEPMDLLLNGGRVFVGIQRHKSSDKFGYTGANVLDALLKAYAALKPQDGTTSGKE